MQRTCSVEGCKNRFASSHKGVDYCNKHYQSMYRYGTPHGSPNVGGNDYEIIDDYAIFYTTKSEPYLVDLEDIDLVKDYKWTKNKSGYLVRNMNQRVILRLQRVVMGVVDPDVVVDHINGNRADNRKTNLRVTTQKNNSRNTRLAKNNTTGYTGVSFTSSGKKYRARIMVDGKEINLGHYEKFEDAKRVRIEAEKKYFGVYAPSNGALKHLSKH